MNPRHIRWLLWLLVLVAMGGTGQNGLPAPDPGGALSALPLGATQPRPEQGVELPPLPPDPAEWVCQDPVSVVSPAAIDAWCSANVNRGLPTPTTLQIPPRWRTYSRKMSSTWPFKRSSGIACTTPS
jgi:hypothetical protein